MVGKKGHIIMMNREKGVFSKLLSIAGVILVVLGVFVFQGASRADDTTAPVESNLGLTTGEGEPVDPGEGEDDEPEVPEVPKNKLGIEYYTTSEALNEETGEVVRTDTLVRDATIETDDTSKIFAILDFKPAGEGNFIAWYDEETEKYYTAGDEIALSVEKPILKLVAKFTLLRNFALEYDTDGGAGRPNSQACESYLDTCDFVISSMVPVRDGFEFKGWQKVGDDDAMIYAPGASVRSRSTLVPLRLRAVWAEIRTYTLIYEGNGGSGIPTAQECRSASGSCRFKVSDIMPTRNDFEFMNWQKGIEVVMPGTEITVTESTTILVANWNPITVFTLEYVADDAKDIPESGRCETFMGTCTFIITDKEPTKEGFIFKGWRLEDKEDMLAKAGDQLEVGVDGPLNLRLIAVWGKLYPVLNSGEVFGVGERIMIRADADYNNFKELIIDEEPVPEDYFKISQGGATSVILSNAFSQALSAGEHAFKVVWEDGEANGVISVNQNEDGTKRFIIVDAAGSTDGMSLMLRPKAGAVSKESAVGIVHDTAKDNTESNFDAVRTLIIVAIVAFAIIYLVNKFYIRHKMEFIENFD